jgi:hypothetical protein
MQTMSDLELSLIFKGLSHILGNQEYIMKQMNIGDPYIVEDTNALAVKYGKLAKKYYKQHNPNWIDDSEPPYT